MKVKEGNGAKKSVNPRPSEKDEKITEKKPSSTMSEEKAEIASVTEMVAPKDNNEETEVKRLDEIEVSFNFNSKYKEKEFATQLADQQKGMNELTVQEYQENRQKYLEQGRAIESNAFQQQAREQALVEKIDELQDENPELSYGEAKQQALEWLDTQAALHNPDQVAGGKADNIGGMGDKRINSSIGSQWRYRIDDVDEQVEKMTIGMSEEEKRITYLNVKLTYVGGHGCE